MPTTRTVTVVVLTFANAAGETFEARFNADDGALGSYSGPGPGWSLVGQDLVSESQLDYGSFETFSSIYGANIANEAVAAGAVRPADPAAGSSPSATNIPGSMIPVQETSHPVGPFGPTTTPAPGGSNTTPALKLNPVLLIGVIVLVLWVRG